MTPRNRFVVLAGLFAMFLLPMRAEATFDLWLKYAPGNVRVGMTSGEAWLAWKPDASVPCKWWKVGNAAGLTDHLNVHAAPEPGANGMIATYTSSASFCGATWSPILLNGWSITFYGGPGPNVLDGRATSMHGANSDDYLFGRPGYTVYQRGELGNDKIITGTTGEVWANFGNDTVCVGVGATPRIVDGGSDVDTYCGPTISNLVSFEVVNPPACGCF